MVFSFTDNLEVISDKPIKVFSKITLLTTAEGGRETPIVGKQRFRPNHNFGNEENRFFHIGQIEFGESDAIHPGESREVEITFLNVKGLSNLLTSGKTWRIQEGENLIGYAKVINIIT